MPTPHTDAYPWDGPADVVDADVSGYARSLRDDGLGNLAAGRPITDDEADVPLGHVRVMRSFDDDLYEPVAVTAPTTNTEYSAAPGMPARGVVLVSAASSLGCAMLDVALTGGLSMF